MTIISELNPDQKAETGRQVTALVRAARPGDAVALGLCDKVDTASGNITAAKSGGSTAAGRRKTKVEEKAEKDHLRDRAALAIDHQIAAWELRDDQPVKQAAALTLRQEMANEGFGFTNFGDEEESEAINRLLTKRDQPGIVEAIETLELGEFLNNLATCEGKFKAVATEKRNAHVAGKQHTASRRQATKSWNKNMRALCDHLSDEYTDEAGRAALATLLQPLAEAGALSRSRRSRRDSGENAAGGDEPPAAASGASGTEASGTGTASAEAAATPPASPESSGPPEPGPVEPS